MPNIVEYRARTDGLQPQEGGIEALNNAARRVGVFYNQMGQDVGGAVRTLGGIYQQHVDFQEQLANGPKLAKATVAMNQGINQIGQQQAAGMQSSYIAPAVPTGWADPNPGAAPNSNAPPSPTE